jgi:hypothetical protein
MRRGLKSVLVPALLAALLAGCGGSSRVSHYLPTRMVAFGDELNLITADGRKHSVNALKTGSTTDVDCAVYPIWSHRVAASYGLVFKECNPGAAPVTADMKAVAGHKVADVAAAVQTYRATTPFTPATLVTLIAGQNDILAAYAAFDGGTLTRDQALAQVTAAGKQLGQLIDSITQGGAGARVIYAWPPDLGDSPFAAAEIARTGGQETRRLLLGDLTRSFINALQPANDGLLVGRVDAELRVKSALNPATLGGLYLTNGTAASCTVLPLTSCTTATLVSAAAANGLNYLWAGEQMPGPRWHEWIGDRAFTLGYNVLMPLE